MCSVLSLCFSLSSDRPAGLRLEGSAWWLRFDDLGMQHRMDAIGEIIMEKGYPTVLCLQASQSPLQHPGCGCHMM